MSNAYSLQNAEWRQKIMARVGRLSGHDMGRPAEPQIEMALA